MKKLLVLICALMLVFGMVGIGSAAPFTYNMGTDSSVDVSGTSSALAMYANVNSNLDDISFTLDDGDSFSFFFSTIGTSESWINGDDLNPGTLTAYLDFDSPDIISAIGGTTIGFSGGFIQRVQGWDLIWNDPVVVSFAGGGQFAISLSDAHFQNNLWGGPDGEVNISATISHNSYSGNAPVPEPATILLMGVGLLGLAGYSRKRLSKKG